ncbi:MAG: hypothetical protein IR153_06000 [Flavobacterium sp.]|nr:hypothetical protein [Flavobacterium sp.]
MKLLFLTFILFFSPHLVAQKIVSSFNENTFGYREELERNATVLFNTSNFIPFTKCANKLFRLSKKADDYHHFSRACVLLSEYYLLHDFIPDSAYFYTNERLNINLLNNNVQEISRSYLDLSVLQYYTNNFFESQESAVEILKICRDLNSSEDKFYAFVQLGMTAHDLGEFKRAEFYHTSALKMSRELTNNKKFKLEENCFNNLGYNHFVLGNYDEAFRNFSRALKGLKTPKDAPELYAILLDNIAAINLQLSHTQHCYQYLERAADIRKNYQIALGQSYNKLLYSKYYWAIGDTTSAIANASESIAICRKSHASRDVLVLLNHLITIDHNHAAEYLSEFQQINDSLQIEESQLKNKFSNLEFEREELITARDSAVRKKWWYVGGSASALLLSGFCLIIIAQKNSKSAMHIDKVIQRDEELAFNQLLDAHIDYENARQASRTKVAMDLHDDVMNKLASLRLNLFLVNEETTKSGNLKYLHLVDKISEVEIDISKIASQINNIDRSENFIFDNKLSDVIRDFQSITDTEITTDLGEGIIDELPPYVQLHLLHIIQEALFNVIKYAEAKKAGVNANKINSFIEVTIYDDGRGFSVPKQNSDGIGLNNMRRRMSLCQGDFNVKSSDIGTTIFLKFPVYE